MQPLVKIGTGICLLMAAACSPQPEQTTTNTEVEPTVAGTQISGSVTYRERITLPPGAELNIRLLDTSLADTTANVLAERNIVDPLVPVEFTLPYDPALIDPRMTYSVRAEIRSAGTLLFTTDTVHPVLTRNSSKSADIVLKKIAADNSIEKAAEPDRRLFSSRWQLHSINGIALNDVGERAPPFIQFAADGRVHGFAGCNNFQGGWTYAANQLQIGPLAVTAMACIEGMDTEQAFFQELENADHHVIERGDLRFFKDSDVVLLFRGSD